MAGPDPAISGRKGLRMLDQPDSRRTAKASSGQSGGPPLDFQEHLARLEAAGLLTRVDRPIDKDTELHPLVRWQFQGGLRDDQRRAFLFTNVTDGEGRRYDVPVAIGALAASRADLCHRHGAPGRGYRQGLDAGHRQSDSAGHRVVCAVPGGRHQRRCAAQTRWRPETFAGADLDARLRLGALPDRHRVHHPGSGNRHPQHGHLSRRAESHRPARRAHGGAARRRRRLCPLAEIPQAEKADADRHRGRRRAGGDVHRAAKAADRLRRDGGGRGTCRRADPRRQGGDCRSPCPGRRRIRRRGADRSGIARAGRPVRRKPRPRRARRLQYVDAGHRDHAQAQAGLGLDLERGNAERVERDEARRLRAALSVLFARHAWRSRACAASRCTSR